MTTTIPAAYLDYARALGYSGAAAEQVAARRAADPLLRSAEPTAEQIARTAERRAADIQAMHACAESPARPPDVIPVTGRGSERVQGWRPCPDCDAPLGARHVGACAGARSVIRSAS